MFVLLAVVQLAAQNPFVRHLTTSDGMPSNNVYKIFQDSKKFIWFATDAGVARYDGSKFTYYRKQDGLSSNDIFEIAEDSFGRIWFFHINASLDFFYNNAVFSAKNTPFLDSLNANYFSRKFYEDDLHNIYFFFNPQSTIYRLDPQNKVTRYKISTTQVDEHIQDKKSNYLDIRIITKDKSGEFNLWSTVGLYRSRTLKENPTLIDTSIQAKDYIVSSTNEKYCITKPIDNQPYIAAKITDHHSAMLEDPLVSTGSDYISSILEDRNGILWISTFDEGVFCFKGRKLIHHFAIKDAQTVMQDHEGNIWISSMKDGAYKVNPYFALHKHIDLGAFDKNGINSMCTDDSSGIWCTNGQSIYNLKGEELYHLDFQKTDNSFNEILKVKPRTLMVGETSKQPYVIEGIHLNPQQKIVSYDKMSQSGTIMKRITVDSQDNQISSFNQFSVFLIHPEQFFRKLNRIEIPERIFSTYYNADHELVINAKKNYILRQDSIKVYPLLSGISNKIITDHLNLNGRSEILNIEGDSLFILNGKRLYNLTAAFIEPIDYQIKRFASHDSILFLATATNIYVCENPLNILYKKSVFLHLVNINFNSIHDILYNNGKLYVGSDEGLTILTAKELYKSDTHPPIPYFQSIQVNDQENLVEQHQISFVGSKKINIAFSCINYSISPLLFSYQLEGADSGWTVTKTNNIVLQDLPKGNFKFKLRARKSSSQWSDPIEFNISIKVPIWKHPLFFFFLLSLVVGIIFLFVLRQKNRELDRREMEHQMILLEQKSLQAMMNPHFIFNSLGSIQNYLLHNKPNEAGIYLSQFARLIRQNLNVIDTSMINLEEEVDRLKNYLDLERLRMEDKFCYTIEIDEAIESEEVLIPSMIIQPFVENSIWHGIANLEENGFIGIYFVKQNDKSLKITIEDSGVGIKNAEKYNTRGEKHLKLGMNITRKRLKLLSQKYVLQTSIEYSEKFPGALNPGTIVVIIVPFLYGSAASNLA